MAEWAGAVLNLVGSRWEIASSFVLTASSFALVSSNPHSEGRVDAETLQDPGHPWKRVDWRFLQADTRDPLAGAYGLAKASLFFGPCKLVSFQV